MVDNREEHRIAQLLKAARTIAVVGLSDNPLRASYSVSQYMQQQGYRIIPVNPSIKSALGEKAYASLAEIEEKIDIVNIFRRTEFVKAIVEQALAFKPMVACIWMQEGIVQPVAAEKARRAGALVVMDRCILKEHARLL